MPADSLHGKFDAIFSLSEHDPVLNSLRTIESDSNSLSKKHGTAVVYCESNFGLPDGKTANGLVRRSAKYTILSVIDSTKAGLNSGVVLDGKPNSIPIYGDLDEALSVSAKTPDYFIFGIAPSSGRLSEIERQVVIDAMRRGMHIVNGMHEFLNDDKELFAASESYGVKIFDVRRPRALKDLRTFSGRIADVKCVCIAVLGTDCAIGKRTTATILTKALSDRGVKTVMISTGQTGLIQGAAYGVALDAVPSQFCAGELESAMVEAYENENPDVILVEGQGALSHPAFSTTAFILRGCCPDGVILQHAPGRSHRCDFEQMAMPRPATEIALIQAFSDTKVIGLTINHENMSGGEIDAAILLYEHELNIPVTDALLRPVRKLVAIVLSAFPELTKGLVARAR